MRLKASEFNRLLASGTLTSPRTGKRTICAKTRQDDEHEIQTSCVDFFRLLYPQFLIFAVPNGGHRLKAVAKKLKAEGVMAGVADLIIVAHKVIFVEMKTAKGRQQSTQKDFERIVTALGYNYMICRSFDEFKTKIQEML